MHGIKNHGHGNNLHMKKSTLISKKAISMIAILLLAMVMLACLVGCSNDQQKLADECVRIHIRANSNNECDQQVKLIVRDKITAYLTDKLSSCKSKQDAINALKKEEQNLIDIANSTLYDNNFAYKASILLKNEYFPTREYDDYTFPEGRYDALIIYLGEGVGDNWWCVAFPPLCFVPNSANGEKIVYKSWVKEWLDKLFAK